MDKANLRFEKNTVLNFCHCKCGGDWLHAAKIVTTENGIRGSMKVWMCDNCGVLYERKIELQRLVIEEELVEVNLSE